ncbi:MAG: hypothetical protein IIB02_09145 [Thaumarchaeota archaeon]|nr:hypothetical protein [Nitrososphaerota archaeon]
MEVFFLSCKTRKIWICGKCKNEAPVLDVDEKLSKHEEPFYRGCIRVEPVRPITGLAIRRGSYPAQMRSWCVDFSLELEHQLAVYRIEYINQTGHDMEDSGYQDKGGD